MYFRKKNQRFKGYGKSAWLLVRRITKSQVNTINLSSSKQLLLFAFISLQS